MAIEKVSRADTITVRFTNEERWMLTLYSRITRTPLSRCVSDIVVEHVKSNNAKEISRILDAYSIYEVCNVLALGRIAPHLLTVEEEKGLDILQGLGVWGDEFWNTTFPALDSLWAKVKEVHYVGDIAAIRKEAERIKEIWTGTLK
jgi:hypothetical protein